MTLHRRRLILWVVVCSNLVVFGASGQALSKLDSNIQFDKLHFTKNKFINNIFQQAVNSVKCTPGPELDDIYMNGKSEEPYIQYQGKIIRHINVEPFGFNRSFTDTSARDSSVGARVGGFFHTTTKKFIIRENLFIQENTPLNAYKVADNERYIRTLEYIHDARIVVDTIAGDADSVDITVYTKDLFSIAGGAASQGFNHINANLYDANLAGLGQKLEVTGLYDHNRSPIWGGGITYRKNNLLHTFAEITAGYSDMNFYSYTHQEESIRFVTLSRQLISPYSRLAGAVTFSHNNNYNIYGIPDNHYYHYKYNLFDIWGGYNLGIGKLTETNNTIRDRRFVAVRYFDRNFLEVPRQIGEHYDPIYNTTHAVLAQLTFFRQDYYKTQYIYGFGTTEDLPYGYNISLIGGWQKQLDLERPYAGINLTRFFATNHGDFIQLYLRGGGYLHDNKIQDGSFLVGATAYGRLMFWNCTKIRPYISTNFTNLYNRVTYPPLRINNFYGIRGFLADSVYGSTRFSVQLETEFYLKYRILGFQFAPFPYCDFTFIGQENTLRNASLYTSLGGGIRARNENLTFETIEMRAYFFPIAPDHMRGFKIIINANIRYRYSSSFITAPDVVQLNNQ